MKLLGNIMLYNWEVNIDYISLGMGPVLKRVQNIVCYKKTISLKNVERTELGQAGSVCAESWCVKWVRGEFANVYWAKGN